MKPAPTKRSALGLLALLALMPVNGLTQEAGSGWEPVTGAEALRDFVSDRTFVWTEGRGEQSGEYRSDGTATVRAWGGEFERTWEVRSDDQLCFSGEPSDNCNTVESNLNDNSLYRVTDVATGVVTEIRLVSDDRGEIRGNPAAVPNPNAGGAARPSADELAAKLSNPANPVMKLGNNFDYSIFDGELPGANDQSSFRYLFLTVFPFKLDSGNSLLVRPGIPVVFQQPVPAGPGTFDDIGTDIGDTAYDVIYSGTTKTGTIWGYGLVGSIPTASDDRLGTDLWGLGPEVLLGKAGKWGAFGGLLAHQWDVGGSGSGKINTTTLNYFYGYGIGNGWQLSAAPTISYNHEAASGNRLTLPLGIGIAKTMLIGDRPWTFQLQYWNNIERPDTFGAEHTFRFAVLPVVSAPWNKGK
jgi:hypothetical protein